MELFFVNYTEVYCPICAYKCQYYSVIIWGVKGVCLLSTYGSAALRPGLVAPSVLGRSRPRPLRRAGASRAGEGAGAAQAAPLQRRDAAARRRRRSALRHVLRPVVWTLPASAANLE